MCVARVPVRVTGLAIGVVDLVVPLGMKMPGPCTLTLWLPLSGGGGAGYDGSPSPPGKDSETKFMYIAARSCTTSAWTSETDLIISRTCYSLFTIVLGNTSRWWDYFLYCPVCTAGCAGCPPSEISSRAPSSFRRRLRDARASIRLALTITCRQRLCTHPPLKVVPKANSEGPHALPMRLTSTAK